MKHSLEAKNLCALFLAQAERFGDRVFLRAKYRAGQPIGDFQTLTYRETAAQAKELAAGLICLGLRAGDRVAIFSPNRPRWIITDQAVQMAGGISVPLYPTLTPRQLVFLMNNAQARFAIVGSRDHLKIMVGMAKEIPTLVKIVTLDPLRERPDQKVAGYEEIQEFGRDLSDPAELERRTRGIREIDPLAIIYTPGTTGDPKGVVLTQANFVANLRQILASPLMSVLHKKSLPLNALCHLPLSNVYGRLFDYHLQLATGGEITFTEGYDTLIRDLAELKPQVINSVPSFFGRIYEMIENEGKVLESGERQEYERVMSVWADLVDALNSGKRVRLPVFRNLFSAYRFVQEKIRTRLGLERWVLAVSGGGALDPAVSGFIRSLGVQMAECYGLTETSPVLSWNSIERKNRQKPPGFLARVMLGWYFSRMVEHQSRGKNPFESLRGYLEMLAAATVLFPRVRVKDGTVGRPLRGTEIRVSGDGEIMVQGAQVFNPRYGYWARPDSVQEVFSSDGWFRTGDVGEIDGEGFLRVIDRKQDLFTTGEGRKIAPGPLELRLARDPFIDQAVVIGNNLPFLSALIVPNFEMLERVIRERNIPVPPPAELVQSPTVRDLIGERVEKLNQSLADYEKIKRFRLLSRHFSEAGGECTPILQLKRRVIPEKYREVIEELYRG